MNFKTDPSRDFFNAAVEGNIGKARIALSSGADINSVNEAGETALMYAVFLGYTDFVKFILSKNADVNAIGRNGYTAVNWAIITNNKELLELLLENGANPNVKDIYGFTPLMHAAIKDGTIDILDVLIKNNADINETDNSGGTALMYAIMKKIEKSINFLIEKGAAQTEMTILMDLQRKVDEIDFD